MYGLSCPEMKLETLFFLPTSSPSPNFFGGTRPGNNLFANSIVALRASTGELVWYFQIVHHDVWDYDLPAQPIVTTINQSGKLIPVVVQLTKQGLIFVLHRDTGKPFFPIEERTVSNKWGTRRDTISYAAIPSFTSSTRQAKY